MNYDSKKPLTEQANAKPPDRRAPQPDRRMGDRRRSESELQIFDMYARVAFAQMLKAEFQKNGCLEGVNSGNRIDYEAISRMSLISAKVMVRQRRDFAKQYESRRQ